MTNPPKAIPKKILEWIKGREPHHKGKHGGSQFYKGSCEMFKHVMPLVSAAENAMLYLEARAGCESDPEIDNAVAQQIYEALAELGLNDE